MYIYSKQQWNDTQRKPEKVVTVDEIFAYFVLLLLYGIHIKHRKYPLSLLENYTDIF